MQSYSSRDFTNNVAAAKRAAESGPVYILDRGEPAHVLLSIERYRALTAPKENLCELLAMPGLDDIDFDPPRLAMELVPADLLDVPA